MPSAKTAFLGNFAVQGAPTTSALTSFTLTTANNGEWRRCTANTDVTVTVPSGLGLFTMELQQVGTGRVIVVAGSGVTLTNPQTAARTTGPGAVASIICTAANACILAGNVEALP
jgi:hypothetical protein